MKAPLCAALILALLPGWASAQQSGIEIMRAGKYAPEPDQEAAEKPAPECKTLSSGATFCMTMENGVRRWVLQGKRQPDFKVGDVFPVYKHSMLMNLRRYDLPAVTGKWRYYVVAGMIYRVDAETKKVLEVIGPTYAR